MNKNIKRSLLVLAVGFFAYFTFETIRSWDENVRAFKDGYEAGKGDYEKSKE